MTRYAIYRYGAKEKIIGSQIPRNAIVEYVGRPNLRKLKKIGIRYNGVFYWTEYGKLTYLPKQTEPQGV